MQRWDARGGTDSRVPVTPERAREPAGGNRPYQSPEGLRAQARSPSTAKMAAATVATEPLGTPRPEQSPPSASMLPVDLRADDARRAPEGELVSCVNRWADQGLRALAGKI